jgi:SH3 domain protein
MTRNRTVLLLSALLVSTSVVAQAETRYVSDELKITLRNGKGTQYRILDSLQSGTPLEVLKADPEAGYSYVRTPSGKEGWVHTRFLMDERAARDRIADIRQRMESMQARMEEMEGQKAQLANLQKENARLQSKLKELKELSANAVALKERAEKLETRRQEQAKSLRQLREENRRLQDRSNKDWFIRGAGVVIAGILLGLILPRLRLRKKRRYEL